MNPEPMRDVRLEAEVQPASHSIKRLSEAEVVVANCTYCGRLLLGRAMVHVEMNRLPVSYRNLEFVAMRSRVRHGAAVCHRCVRRRESKGLEV